MPQTIAVTGASGYIAKHIILRLLNDGHIVRGSVRKDPKGDAVRAALAHHVTPDALQNRLSFVSLDLSRDDGWDALMQGCDVLMHTASPFPLTPPKDPQDLIRPAVDGTLRALNAAHTAGLKRVILTSSTVAISGDDLPPGDAAYDERHWTDPDRPGTSAYSASKTLAERAAWDFVQTKAPDMQLTTINPGFVQGTPLDGQFGTSIKVIERILAAKDPALPRLGFAAVDVRDVADLHLAAMNTPDTAGQRIMAARDFLWFADLARAIKDDLPHRRIVTRQAPDWLIRILARFDPAIRGILPDLGKQYRVNPARAETLLGRHLRDPSEAAKDSARYLDQAGQ